MEKIKAICLENTIIYMKIFIRFLIIVAVVSLFTTLFYKDKVLNNVSTIQKEHIDSMNFDSFKMNDNSSFRLSCRKRQ